jgi:hypothetical protein
MLSVAITLIMLCCYGKCRDAHKYTEKTVKRTAKWHVKIAHVNASLKSPFVQIKCKNWYNDRQTKISMHFKNISAKRIIHRNQGPYSQNFIFFETYELAN